MVPVRRLVVPLGKASAAVVLVILVTIPDVRSADPINSVPPRSTSDIVKSFAKAPRNYQEIEGFKADVAAEPPPPSAFAGEKIAFYKRRSDAARKIGDFHLLLADLQELNSLYNGTDLRIVNELASAFHLAGNEIEALRLREQVTRDSWASISSRMTNNAALAGYAAEAGEFDKARIYLQRAENLFQEVRSRAGPDVFPGWLGTIDLYRGELAYHSGKFEEAEAAYRRAVAARIEIQKLSSVSEQQKYDLTSAQLSLSRSLLRLNRLAEAEFYAREALNNSIKDTGYYSLATGRSLALLGWTLGESGRLDDAGELAQLAIKIFEHFNANGVSVVLAGARQLLGEVLIANGRMEEAVAVFVRRASDLQSEPITGKMSHKGSAEWGYALARLGRTAEAIPILRQLAQEYELRSGVNSVEFVATRAFEAVALAASGEREAALELFSTYVPQLAARTFSDNSAEGASFRTTLRLQRVVDAYLSLIAQVAASAPESSESLIAEAFSAADIARGSSVQRALAASSARATIGNPKLAELARREQDLGNRVASLSQILADLFSRPAEQQLPKVQADLKHDIETMKDERTKLRATILKQFPDYAELIAPRPVSIGQVQAQLLPGEVLVSIYSTADSTYVWAVPQVGAPSFADAKLGANQIASKVETLRRALDVGDVSLENFPQFDTALAHVLYAALLKPIESALRSARSLLVVPYGALGQIPFALLVTEPVQLQAESMRFAEYRRVPFLVRKYAISQLPSVSTLVTLRRAARPAVAQQAFVGFGDPVFRQGPRQETGKTMRRSMRLRNLAVGRVDAQGLPTASNEIGNLSPLPDTAEEIKDIAAVLGADVARDIFLQTAASESNVRKQDLSNRRIVVFATHGLVPGDLNGLTQPALALSNPAVTGERDVDGLLTMEEVLSLKLNADWVVLSACNTAAADGKGAEAVSGLGRAFFFAGARALLVSNWPVETESARAITTDLFRRQVADAKLSRAQALQRTLLNLIDMDGANDAEGRPLYAYAHPMFWAPFTLVGDGAR